MIALVCALVVACQSEEEHPPEFKPAHDGPPPLSCAELVDAGWSESKPAACAANGLVCPLFALSTCDAGQVAVALCDQRVWELSCVTLPDSSP